MARRARTTEETAPTPTSCMDTDSAADMETEGLPIATDESLNEGSSRTVAVSGVRNAVATMTSSAESATTGWLVTGAGTGTPASLLPLPETPLERAARRAARTDSGLGGGTGRVGGRGRGCIGGGAGRVESGLSAGEGCVGEVLGVTGADDAGEGGADCGFRGGGEGREGGCGGLAGNSTPPPTGDARSEIGDADSTAGSGSGEAAALEREESTSALAASPELPGRAVGAGKDGGGGTPSSRLASGVAASAYPIVKPPALARSRRRSRLASRARTSRERSGSPQCPRGSTSTGSGSGSASEWGGNGSDHGGSAASTAPVGPAPFSRSCSHAGTLVRRKRRPEVEAGPPETLPAVDVAPTGLRNTPLPEPDRDAENGVRCGGGGCGTKRGGAVGGGGSVLTKTWCCHGSTSGAR